MDETNSDAHVFLSIYFNKFYDLTQSDIDAFVEYQKQFLGKRKVLIRIGPEMNGKTTKKIKINRILQEIGLNGARDHQSILKFTEH